MNERDALERRISALIEAYADRAPIDVDPIAVTRLVATGSRRTSPLRVPFVPSRGLAFTIVILTLLVTIATGVLVAGAQLLRRDPVEILTERAHVEPYVGLPPEGAAPSTPEQGELVLSFGGRVSVLGGDFHRMWLYADGRLIWKSNLEGGGAERGRRFGASEPTTAVIEQHLTPEGVELVRSAAIEAGLRDRQPFGPDDDPTGWHRPGVIWGGLVLRDGGGFVQANWYDPALPGLLADPASWLPESAWKDQRLAAYVPSRYAVCLGHAAIALPEILERVPEPARDLIRSKAIEGPAPDWNEHDRRCLYEVPTDDVRAIAAGLEDAGLRRNSDTALSYAGIVDVQLLVVLPNGDVVCHCG
jgi:hypothetical protein